MFDTANEPKQLRCVAAAFSSQLANLAFLGTSDMVEKVLTIGLQATQELEQEATSAHLRSRWLVHSLQSRLPESPCWLQRLSPERDQLDDMSHMSRI